MCEGAIWKSFLEYFNRLLKDEWLLRESVRLVEGKVGKLKQQERRLNKFTGAKSRKKIRFWIFILRQGEPWEVIKFVVFCFLFF